MVSTGNIISIVVALAVAIAVVFVIDNFVLKREFDIQKTIIDIVVVGVILTIGSMVSQRLTKRKGIEPPKVSL